MCFSQISRWIHNGRVTNRGLFNIRGGKYLFLMKSGKPSQVGNGSL